MAVNYCGGYILLWRDGRSVACMAVNYCGGYILLWRDGR